MLNYELLVTIVFRILNFGVFVAVCLYVYRRYIRPMTETEMAAQEGFVKGLKEQKNVLEARYYELNEQVAQQKANAQNLNRKIELWKERFEVQLTQKDKEKDLLKQVLIKRLEIQAHSLEQEYIKKQVAPVALKNAQDELVNYFADNVHQREYIQELLSLVSKRSLHE